MLLEIFLLISFVGIILLAWGYGRSSYPAAYLGLFVMLILGLFLFQSGIEISNGKTYLYNDSNTLQIGEQTTYTTITANNDTMIYALAHILIFGAIGMIILTTLIVLRS